MTRNVLISAVGLEYERILAGLTYFPSNVLYLLRDDEPRYEDEGQRQLFNATFDFTDSIRKKAEDLHLEVHEIYKDVRLNDIESCIRELKKIFFAELNSDSLNQISVNVSTATKNFALAAYLLAAYNQGKIPVRVFYLQAKHYTILQLFTATDLKQLQEEYRKKGMTSGEYSLEEIPVIPFANISSEMKSILSALESQEKFSNLMDLLIKLKPRFKFLDNSNQKSVRMKYNYVLHKLEGLNLVHQEKKGREVEISITEIGRLLNLIVSD